MKKKYIKNLLALILLTAIFSGCASLNLDAVVYAPENPLLHQIEDQCMDCKQAAIMGQQVLRGMELKSCITCGFWLGSNDPRGPGHCWNEVFSPEDQKWHLVDLNRWGDEGWSMDQYPEYIPVSRWYGFPSVFDLTFDQGADWYASEDDVSEIIKNLPEPRRVSRSAGVVPKL